MDKRTGKKEKQKKKSKLDGSSFSTDKWPLIPLKPTNTPQKR